MARMYLALAFAGALLAMSQEASAQICRPVAERTAELGCWIVANGQLGTLSKPEVFWQLDIFPTRAAADVAKTPSGTVVEALGKTWLLTIGDAGGSQPAGNASPRSDRSRSGPVIATPLSTWRRSFHRG